MSEAREPKPDALDKIQRNTRRATPGMKYVVHTTNTDDIRVDNIEVPENQRGKGVATRAFKGLHNYANKINKNVSLTPVAKDKSNQGRLEKYYKKLGYRKRRKTDKIAGADTMIRRPNS